MHPSSKFFFSRRCRKKLLPVPASSENSDWCISVKQNREVKNRKSPLVGDDDRSSGGSARMQLGRKPSKQVSSWGASIWMMERTDKVWSCCVSYRLQIFVFKGQRPNGRTRKSRKIYGMISKNAIDGRSWPGIAKQLQGTVKGRGNSLIESVYLTISWTLLLAGPSETKRIFRWRWHRLGAAATTIARFASFLALTFIYWSVRVLVIACWLSDSLWVRRAVYITSETSRAILVACQVSGLLVCWVSNVSTVGH